MRGERSQIVFAKEKAGGPSKKIRRADLPTAAMHGIFPVMNIFEQKTNVRVGAFLRLQALLDKPVR